MYGFLIYYIIGFITCGLVIQILVRTKCSKEKFNYYFFRPSTPIIIVFCYFILSPIIILTILFIKFTTWFWALDEFKNKKEI